MFNHLRCKVDFIVNEFVNRFSTLILKLPINDDLSHKLRLNDNYAAIYLQFLT